MLTIAYFDCPTGIAGDMCLGALVDAGVPLDYIDHHLKSLRISNEYNLSTETVHRNGQRATKVHVHLTDAPPDDHEAYSYDEDHAHDLSRHEPQRVRHLPDIQTLIQTASLPTQATNWSLAIFQKLAEAEGRVHGVSPERVHFHEVGATDAIVDIVGTCLGLDYLGIKQMYCSALPMGGGIIKAAHGMLPAPAPAVLKLWEMRQVPIYNNGINRELVTPTGAAIATTLATQFGPPPPMHLHKVGLGAGSRDFPIPNILRLWLGCESSRLNRVATQHDHGHAPPLSSALQQNVYHEESSDAPIHQHHSVQKNDVSTTTASRNTHNASENQKLPLEQVTVLETQVDDLTPQAIGFLFDALFQAGALDVFTQAVGMKKSRPGILITVICQASDVQDCESVLFQETTTLGIRRTEQSRSVLHREIKPIETPYGSIRLKIARRSPNTPILNVQPEYEDCAQIARATGSSWLTVHQAAMQSWFALQDISK